MRRVLVVDDEPLVRRAIERALSRAGYAVSGAEDIADATGLLLREVFDLLVCDLRLPSGSGHDVVAAARELAPGMPVILLSGEVPPDDPPVRQLAKPISGRDLVAAITEALAA